jgi:hypothetical protein
MKGMKLLRGVYSTVRTYTDNKHSSKNVISLRTTDM